MGFTRARQNYWRKYDLSGKAVKPEYKKKIHAIFVKFRDVYMVRLVIKFLSWQKVLHTFLAINFVAVVLFEEAEINNFYTTLILKPTLYLLTSIFKFIDSNLLQKGWYNKSDIIAEYTKRSEEPGILDSLRILRGYCKKTSQKYSDFFLNNNETELAYFSILSEFWPKFTLWLAKENTSFWNFYTKGTNFMTYGYPENKELANIKKLEAYSSYMEGHLALNKIRGQNWGKLTKKTISHIGEDSTANYFGQELFYSKLMSRFELDCKRDWLAFVNKTGNKHNPNMDVYKEYYSEESYREFILHNYRPQLNEWFDAANSFFIKNKNYNKVMGSSADNSFLGAYNKANVYTETLSSEDMIIENIKNTNTLSEKENLMGKFLVSKTTNHYNHSWKNTFDRDTMNVIAKSEYGTSLNSYGDWQILPNNQKINYFYLNLKALDNSILGSYWSSEVIPDSEICEILEENLEFSQYSNTDIEVSDRVWVMDKYLDSMVDTKSSLLNPLNFDFTDPASLEFRGIYELYHFVMLKLMFVFMLLVVLYGFAVVKCCLGGFDFSKKDYLNYVKKNNSIRLEHRAVSKLSEILGLSSLYNINDSKKLGNRLSRWLSSALINRKVKLDLKFLEKKIENVGIVGMNSYQLSNNNLIKISNLFTPATYWVYYSKLEFIWTLVPCVILLFISLPSFTLALALDETYKPSLWVKVIGNQWYWIYEYSTYDENVLIYSNIVYGSDLEFNSLRLLKPDLSITIINNKFTRFLVTSSDVIHSWTVPALGIKIDACPGRINSISILPTRSGVYYGQCSEICGVNHAFMPIAVEVIA